MVQGLTLQTFAEFMEKKGELHRGNEGLQEVQSAIGHASSERVVAPPGTFWDSSGPE